MNCKPYIRAHADELLESLAALVRIPSVGLIFIIVDFV